MSEFRIGNVSGSQNYFGDHGTQHNIVRDSSRDADLTAVIENLIGTIAVHRSQLDNADDLAALAKAAATYASEPQPKIGRIRSLLPALTAGAGAVTAVSDAVAHLAQAVDSL